MARHYLQCSNHLESSEGYILSRNDERFHKINLSVLTPSPNAYIQHDFKTIKVSKIPFGNKDSRFKKIKCIDMPTVGSYNVTNDVGRQVKPWRKAPQSTKTSQSKSIF